MEKRYDNISKIRLLKVWEILRTETDEDNPMGTPILLQKLANQGIKCDRRTVYRDIQLLNDFGYEILHNRGISNQYFVVDRSFDVPELRILLDAVQAASFITPKKTEVLVDKIADLAGSHRAELLKNNIVRFNIGWHRERVRIHIQVHRAKQFLQARRTDCTVFMLWMRWVINHLLIMSISIQ